MPNITKSPQAFVDLDELAAHIQKDNPDAARRFLLSAEWTFNLLAAMPQMGKEYKHPRHDNLRVWYVRRPFRNYKIFYQAVEDGILVVRVLHSARDIPTQLGTSED
ncbi:MAG: type II toxin-antitoxin system RelE/ParE family toxin [Planctomycetota bacterium]